jgi:hypothetical protein
MVRLLLIGLLAMIAPEGISAFSPTTGLPLQRLPRTARTIAVDMAMSSEVDRRTVFANAVAIAGGVLLAPSASFGLNTTPADNEIVKEQRTVVSKLDINNAAVADYMQLPGMYPTIGGKIANNGPYNSIQDVYKLKVLSKAEKAAIKKYESKLTATAATGLDTMRGRDPNRRSFNK